jgi:hypothetical protein
MIPRVNSSCLEEDAREEENAKQIVISSLSMTQLSIANDCFKQQLQIQRHEFELGPLL